MVTLAYMQTAFVYTRAWTAVGKVVFFVYAHRCGLPDVRAPCTLHRPAYQFRPSFRVRLYPNAWETTWVQEAFLIEEDEIHNLDCMPNCQSTVVSTKDLNCQQGNPYCRNFRTHHLGRCEE